MVWNLQAIFFFFSMNYILPLFIHFQILKQPKMDIKKRAIHVYHLYIARMERNIHITAEVNKMTEVTRFLLNLIAYAQKRLPQLI